jgi:hypothetical protein
VVEAIHPAIQMTARDNPFAPGRLRRVLGFDPVLAGTTWEKLESRWHQLGCRAAVTGHRGSGKTSLLDAWAERFDESPLRLFFNDRHRDFDAADRAVLASCAGKVLFIDGENHLSWLRRRELRRASQAAAGVLVARHGRGGWPELIRLRSSAQQAAILLDRASPECSARFLPEVADRWQANRGNLRLLLLGCYDDLAAGKKTFEKT